MNKLTRSISVGDQIFTLSIFLKSAVFYTYSGAVHKTLSRCCSETVQPHNDWQLFVTLGGKSLHIIQGIIKSCLRCNIQILQRCVVCCTYVFCKILLGKKKTGGGGG